jgi:hypothetical protein
MVHDAGKGSKRRPTSEEKYIEGWERIFLKNEYQDILSTEECLLSALKAVEKKEIEKGNNDE